MINAHRPADRPFPGRLVVVTVTGAAALLTTIETAAALPMALAIRVGCHCASRRPYRRRRSEPHDQHASARRVVLAGWQVVPRPLDVLAHYGLPAERVLGSYPKYV